jgi:hypothetical protein
MLDMYTHSDHWEHAWGGASEPIVRALHAAIAAAELNPHRATQTLDGLGGERFQARVYDDGVEIEITYADGKLTVEVAETGTSPGPRSRPAMAAAKAVLEDATQHGRDKLRAPLVTRLSDGARQHKELIGALGVLAAFLGVAAAFLA